MVRGQKNEKRMGRSRGSENRPHTPKTDHVCPRPPKRFLEIFPTAKNLQKKFSQQQRSKPSPVATYRLPPLSTILNV